MQKTKLQRTPKTKTGRVFSSNLTTPGGGAPGQDRGTAASDTSSGSGTSRHNGNQGPCGLTPTRTADNKSVSSGPKCKQFFSGQNVESSSNGIQQIMTQFNGAVLEEAKILAITKIVSNLMEQNGH
jgi:hypothetical protein